MPHQTPKPRPLTLKPDLPEAARRWEAYFAGEMLDRPIVCVTAPKHGPLPPWEYRYRQKVFGDMDEVIDEALARAEATYYAGEAIPSFFPSFGPDEIAVFTGAEFAWSDDSAETNWSVPHVEDWDEALPLRLQAEHPLWQRMVALNRRAVERLAGKMLIQPIDLHTNMDLLAAVRGPQRLCMDLRDRPEAIDRAMVSARAIFPETWTALSQAARMDEWGYCHAGFSMTGMAVLQCDFSAMIGPEMFRRWVLPALEEEAEIVKHVIYHWDGPAARVHTADLIASRGLHTLSYVPGDGHGDPIDHIELHKHVQAGGKAVQVWGTPDQIKRMHRELRPDKVCYFASAATPDEADALLEWFVRNT